MKNAITWAANVGGAKTRLTVELNEAGAPIGVSTAGLGLPGSALDDLWRCFVRAWDINLKKGRVPLEALKTFLGRMDEMAGETNDPLAPEAGGPADYFAKSCLVRVGPPELADLVRAAGMAGGCSGE
jgi:hypothetical protein